MLGVGEFAKDATEIFGQFNFQRSAVEGGSLLGFVCSHRFALHELALYAVERGEFIVATGECEYLIGNTKEL